MYDKPISPKNKTETGAGKEQIITIQNIADWGIIHPLKESDNTNYKYYATKYFTFSNKYVIL